MALYNEIAAKLQQHIDSGVFPYGERLPGVRRLSKSLDVSISTIVQAQRLLEDSGVLIAKARSGFYVAQCLTTNVSLPTSKTPKSKPLPVATKDLMMHLGQLSQLPEYVQMGFAIPHGDFLPLRAVQRSFSKVIRQYDHQLANYAPPTGFPELQLQISLRMQRAASKVQADEVLITSGAQEALTIALKSIAKPGDIIAIESPTYYGMLQVIESLGMKAIEIATDPVEGISCAALTMALKKWPIKACLLIVNCHNPLGFTLSDQKKQQLVDLAYSHDFLLIEDDIYGELNQTEGRERSLHSFDKQQQKVVYYSSFSKTISAGLRIGWLVLPPHLQVIGQQTKQILNLSSNTLAQAALCEYLANGGYDKHLRQVKMIYTQQIQKFIRTVIQHFPQGTRVSQPAGGYVLWIELAQNIDTLVLSQRLFAFDISIAPGKLFSLSDHYNNCLRLNCAQPWSAKLEHSLAIIGREIALLSPH
jgi:DNA-binding transcriptional MocR family regulator